MATRNMFIFTKVALNLPTLSSRGRRIKSRHLLLASVAGVKTTNPEKRHKKLADDGAFLTRWRLAGDRTMTPRAQPNVTSSARETGRRGGIAGGAVTNWERQILRKSAALVVIRFRLVLRERCCCGPRKEPGRSRSAIAACA